MKAVYGFDFFPKSSRSTQIEVPSGMDQSELFRKLEFQAKEGHIDLKSVRILTDQKLRFRLSKIVGEALHKPINFSDYEITDPDLIFKVARYNVTKFSKNFSANIQKYPLDNSHRFEIAKLAADYDKNFSNFVKMYNLDSSQSFVVAKRVASQKGSKISKFIENYQLQNPQERYKIAKLAAKKDDNLSAFIKNYQIEHSEYRYKLAKIVATKIDNISQFIENYDLNEQQLFKIAKSAVIHDFTFFENIEKYHLDESQSFEILKIAAKSHPTFSKEIDDFELDTPQSFEIAKIAAENKLCPISEYIENYHLNNQQKYFEVAKIAVIHDPSFFTNIKKFQLNSEQLLTIFSIAAASSSTLSANIQKHHLSNVECFTIAKIAATCEHSSISRFIENYDLKPEQNFEVALIAAANDPLFSSNVKNYHLTREQLFDVAKIAAAKKSFLPSQSLSKQIENYHLTPEQNFAVALIAAANDPNFSSYVKKYNLNKKQLLEVAQIAATNDLQFSSKIHEYHLTSEELFDILKIAATFKDSKISAYIDGYNLDPEQRFTLAKVVAAVAPNFSHYVRRYNLNQEQRFIVAKIAASFWGSQISNYIGNYNLDIEQRIEIAKIASRFGDRISANIDEYDIENPQQLFEIAKLALLAGDKVSQYIVDYEIESPEQLFELAKLAAIVGDSISVYIKNYNIESREQRFEIAKIAATMKDSDISLFIGNYHLTSDQNFEIAKLAARAGDNVFKFIKDYNLSYEQALEVAKISSSLHPENLKRVLKYPFTKEDQHLLILLSTIAQGDVVRKIVLKGDEFPWAFIIKRINSVKIIGEDQENANRHLSDLKLELKALVREKHSHSSSCQKMLTWIDSSTQADSPLLRQKLLSWTAAMMGLCSEQMASDSEFDSLFPILDNLSTLPDPNLRRKFSLILATKFIGSKQAQLRKWQIKLADHKVKHQRPVAAMWLASLASDGEPQDATKFIEAFYSNKQHSTSGSAQKTILELLVNLEESNWSSKEKALLLKKLIDNMQQTKDFSPIPQNLSKEARRKALEQKRLEQQRPNLIFLEMLESAQIASDLLLTGKGNRLKEIVDRHAIKFLMENVYQEILGEEKNVSFIENYLNTFGRFRDKQALWTYYARLQTLPLSEKNETLFWFKFYVQTVLDGTFIQKRYTSNEHLKTVFAARPDLEETWKFGKRFDFMNESKPLLRNEELDSLLSIFKDAIIDKKHLGEEAEKEYPDLFHFLKHPNDREEILKSIESQREHLLDLNTKRATNKRKNTNLLNKLRFQKCVLEIFSSPERFASRLQEAIRLAPANEFKNDLVNALKYQKAQTLPINSDLLIVDTDDPCDFLLMGTEVEESCQKVDGSPELNRGLLGTALNGQVRMFAVKKEGKLAARALVRLLWDKESKSPLLYLERIYKKTSDPKIEQLLIEMAKHRAKELNLCLVTSYDREKTSYPHAIYSLGGQCPFEYVDALSVSKVTPSSFTIPKSSIVS